jgi:hypothetical protein
MKIERRKNLIVNRLQYRLVLYSFGLVVGVSIVLLIAFIIIFGPKEIFPSNKCLAFSVSIFVILQVLLYYFSYITLLKLSNRIYGPLYRLSIYLKKLSEGIETGEIRFRKDDIIDDVQKIYNELCHSLTKTLHYDYNELVNTFSQLEDILDHLHKDDISKEELYKSLENICARLAKALDLTTDIIQKKEN